MSSRRTAVRIRARDALEARPRWQRHALLLLAFMALAAPLVGIPAVHNDRLGLYDEWQNVDRIHRVLHGDLMMHEGEFIGRWGDQQLYCRGIERLGPPVADDCRQVPARPPTLNSAATDPPTYFVATGAVASVILATGTVEDEVLAARLVGVLWAAVSMWSVLLLARGVGASSRSAGVVALSPVLVPLFAQQYTYVTPHALGLAVGAFAALATLRWMRRQWSWWPLVLAGLAVAGIKGTNITVVIALGITLMLIALWPRGLALSERLRAVIGAVVLGVSSAVFTAAWLVTTSVLRAGEYHPPGNYVVAELPVHEVIRDSVRFLSGFGEGVLVTPAAWLVMAMAGTALVVWAGLIPDLPPYVRQLAPGYLLGSALGAVALDVLVYVSSNQYFGMHLRYGLALFPVGLAFAALLLRTRTALVLAAVFLVLYTAARELTGVDGLAA